MALFQLYQRQWWISEDINKEREVLGYDLEWNFDHEIEVAIEWYRENMHGRERRFNNESCYF